jgi:hypothetical protein
MANRRDYFFRQRVTEAELDDGFAELEKADQNLAADLGFVGVLANAVVSQHAPVPDLSVDVSGPGAVLDQLGQRIFFSALQNVSVAQDDGGVSTSVSAAGQEKIVSVFLKFDRALSDPRVDGNSLTVFFRRDESFKFIVAQGAQAPAGTALPPPLRSDAILLADVTRTFGQTQVLNANISIARRQDAFVSGGSPRSIRRGKTLEAVSDLLTFLNAHVSGTADRHPAAAVDYAGGGNWADGTTNPAATAEAQLDKIVADLAAVTGAPKVGAAATSGSPNSLSAGTVRSQLDALLGFINAHINNPTNVHAASALSYAGGGNWADGTTNPAATVEGQLDKIVSDLAATTGAPKVGAAATSGSPNSLSAGTVRSQLDALLGHINAHINDATDAHAASAIGYAGGGNWADGTTNPATTVEAQLDKIVSDLVATAGAARVGAAASGNLPAGTVRSQLDALDATSVRTNVANTFTALQTLNGAAGDTNAALATTAAPSTRKLLWEVQAGGSMKVRFYAGLDGSWEVTCNARWDGTQWVRDVSGNNSSRLRMDRFNFTLERKIPSGNFADGTWDGSWDINIPANGLNSWNTDDWFGNGQTTSYAAVQATESDNGNLGAGCTWKHRFSATPSSITFATQSIIGVSSGPFSFAASEIGTGVFVGGAAGTTWFYTHVTAS